MVSYHSDQTVAASHGGSSFTKPVYFASFSGESHFHLVHFHFCLSLFHRNYLAYECYKRIKAYALKNLTEVSNIQVLLNLNLMRFMILQTPT